MEFYYKSDCFIQLFGRLDDMMHMKLSTELPAQIKRTNTYCNLSFFISFLFPPASPPPATYLLILIILQEQEQISNILDHSVIL